MAESVAYNMDCMEYMKSVPDKYFDLCICDPPYGDALASKSVGTTGIDLGADLTSARTIGHLHSRCRKKGGGGETQSYNRFGNPGSRFEKYKRDQNVCNTGREVREKTIAWDVAPGKEIFDEIFRVSRDQIIFGANYFPNMPPTRCFLVWRKLSISESFSMAMAEYAWTSFDANAKVYECAPQGKSSDPRFHPTAKPIDLYRWIYGLFTKPGMKVYDPFLGSGGSRIAAYEAGLDFVGTEIDPIYFAKEEERFERMTNNYSLFD